MNVPVVLEDGGSGRFPKTHRDLCRLLYESGHFYISKDTSLLSEIMDRVIDHQSVMLFFEFGILHVLL